LSDQGFAPVPLFVDQGAAVIEEPVRSSKVADEPGVCSQAMAFAPVVKLETRRLEPEARRRVVAQIQCHLVGDTRAGAGDCAGEADMDVAMQMPTDVPFRRWAG
jgi:hypothetical protein